MIRINLIPVKEKKKRQELFIIACVMLGLFLMVIGMAWVYFLRLEVKTDLKNKIQQVDDESKSYEEKIKEIKDLEAKEASLDGIRKTLKTITDSQRKAISALDLIASKLPDGVWLTGITQGKEKDNNVFTLQGYAFSNSSLEEFFNAFQKPGSSFTDSTLNLTSISAATGLNKSIHQFQITTKLADTSS
jgi:Tfp pilus assembly protein PilN